ncbi:hypothetical protein [Flavobacterium lindanitolerans]|uniref:Lipoprotein n=1 Tax=Flavobacterium lindanitolerans TaxID=428988 RepID=A0A497V588_9FLAO|nr:hypothetical protein [Flavobacterium lindanitolerans]PKW28607.1 hypothetical protein B0G92_0230 [Flavobacterium lindanitolerans]RLJ35888.1 hypothetical protein CLV50_1274 [Flavobacterium lindanitolerans]
MKKSLFKAFSMALLASAAVLTSCSSDDGNNNGPSSTFVLDANNFKGTINDGEVVLKTGVTYKLSGKLVVANGAKLTIEPGAIIEATARPDNSTEDIRYIAVAQGGQIFVNGTATNPVVMTSSVKSPGKWGGLVICGKAPINKGATASAEVSDLTYGGTLANDNSGSIRYLRIEYSGYAYNSEKEFNGLSLFGVGSGTTIEYVQVHEGSDDGIEFFGGTVNTKYLISTSNEDDSFDWTEGWNGTNENWYGKLGLGRGNRGIEADNNSNNHLATPIANPNIKNLTLIGLGAQGSESQALKLRVGTKGKFDNLVLSNFVTGFDVQHNESVGYVADGTLKATNVRFDNITTKSTGKNTAGETVNVAAIYTESTTATGAGNGTATPSWAQGWTVGL